MPPAIREEIQDIEANVWYPARKRRQAWADAHRPAPTVPRQPWGQEHTQNCATCGRLFTTTSKATWCGPCVIERGRASRRALSAARRAASRPTATAGVVGG